MSMIGTSLLNEIIIENSLEDTAEILTKMRDQIIKSLDQKAAQGDNKDGMDMALCKYDPEKKTVQYSGAFNPLIHHLILFDEAAPQLVIRQKKLCQGPLTVVDCGHE